MNDIVHNLPEAQPVLFRPVDPMAEMIREVVLNPQVDVAKLEAVLAMKDRLDSQEARRAFDRAVAAAKASIPPIVKNRLVHFESERGGKVTTYRHEDLAEIARTVDPILAEQGLSYRFRTEQGEGGRVTVACVLSHRDGYYEETSLGASPDTSGSKNNFQAIGSAVTYLQRYTLKAALGLSASSDDDGHGATAEPPALDGEKVAVLEALIKKAGADKAKFLGVLKVDDLAALPAARYEDALGLLNRKIKEAQGA